MAELITISTLWLFASTCFQIVQTKVFQLSRFNNGFPLFYQVGSAVIPTCRYRDVKWDIMKKRKDLKGTGIVFAEDLCNDMKTLFEEVRDYEHVDTAWAWNGKSWVKTSLGKSTSSGMEVSGNSYSLNLIPLWTLMNLPQSPQTAIVMTELSQVNTCTKFQCFLMETRYRGISWTWGSIWSFLVETWQAF